MEVCTYETHICICMSVQILYLVSEVHEATIGITSLHSFTREVQNTWSVLYIVCTNPQAIHMILHWHLVEISSGNNYNTYRYILSDFRVCNYGCRYALCWFNRVFGSSISNCSCLCHIEIVSSWSFSFNEGEDQLRQSGRYVEGTQANKRTNAWKFSNLLMELVCLGSEVSGQFETIRASVRLGRAYAKLIQIQSNLEYILYIICSLTKYTMYFLTRDTL